MVGIVFLLSVALAVTDAEESAVNELFSLIGDPSHKAQPVSSEQAEAAHNHSRTMGKDPLLPVNELLEESRNAGDSKYVLHTFPGGGWPKHSDPALLPRPGHPGKGKKAAKSERLPTEHNSEKSRVQVPEVLPKPIPGPLPDPVPNHTPPSNNPDVRHNARPRTGNPPPAPRKLDPEENRPGKSSLYQPGGRNSSRPSVLFNRRSSSLFYHFDVLRKEPEFGQEALCLSECRKEKDEREHYCYSEFAINGIVHDIEVIRKGIRLVVLLVSSDGFYKMSRLYVTPDSYFFKVRILVLDTYRCSKPCPDLKLGSRYIIMGQIYHRRRHLPNDLLTLLGGKLKPGDGLLRSNNYVKRFNKGRHQKAQDASRARCR